MTLSPNKATLDGELNQYGDAMQGIPPSSHALNLMQVVAWRRLKLALIVCVLMSLIMWPSWKSTYALLLGRWLLVGLFLVLVFGVLERRPRKLPSWLARWALQVVGVAIAAPIALAIVYKLTTLGEQQPWWQDGTRLNGFRFMLILSLLVAPWVCVAALFQQISGAAQRQALAFALERSQLERQASDARLRLLQAQIEPHFLFNTLANVRELVDSGSPQASSVLASLIAYLRAAVPRLHEPVTTVAQELQLVRAYLELMQMRMPDRLQFVLHADDAALALRCPPMTLLTLVENAVRHGIDPSEEGGRIEVRVRLRNGRCVADVCDTGIGLQTASDGLGTGLASLRERLQLVFGGEANLRIVALAPHGVSAEVEFPAQRGK